MKQIEISQEDFDFLKELQHELNTQVNDGNADPVFWGVMETREELVPEGCGEFYRISFDDGWWSLEEAVERINDDIESYDQEAQDKWKEVDKDDIFDICEFIRNDLKWDNVYDVVETRDFHRLSEETGAFLTKRACADYIKKYAYNHDRPQTYAMTAYRNFELGKLLKILKTIKLE